MRQRFSTRLGVNRPEKLIDNAVPVPLRTRLWNTVCHYYLGESGSYDPKAEKFISEFFVNFSAVRPAVLPGSPYAVKYLIEGWWGEARWGELYDFVEFVASYDDLTLSQKADVGTKSRRFQQAINSALHDEYSAFVFRDAQLMRRLSDDEYQTRR